MKSLNQQQRKTKMSDEDDKVKKFPIEKLGIEEEDEVLWECKACDHKITDSMEKSNAEKSKVLPLNMGGVMIYTCPNCYTLQIPSELFEEILKKAGSNIIT